jgi:hypothetical protein
MLESFIENQIVAFEKERVEIPMTYVPKFAARYNIDEPVSTRNFGTQCCFLLSKYRKDFLKKENNIAEYESHLHMMNR